MRPLSSETRVLVDALPPRVPAAADAALIALVRAIGERREAGALGRLLPFLPGHGVLAEATATAIAHIVAALPLKRYPELEELRGSGWVIGELSPWWSLAPGDIPALATLADGGAALGMASLHRSGFVREAAGRARGGRTHEGGREVPFLFLRINDWVEPVRRAATVALAGRIAVAHADALWRALPLVDRLRGQKRADHRGIIRWVEMLLRDPEARPALARAMASPDRYVRRQAAAIVLGSDEIAEEAILRALGDADDLVRLAGAQRLARLGAATGPAALLRALDDASAAVRRVALDALDALVDDAAVRRRALEKRLGDRQPYLRELAHQRLRALDGAFDLAAHYRRLLAAARSGAELRAAVGGLASCGIEEDVLVVEPIATDARAKVRGAALQAMAVLDGDSVAFLLDGLIDPSRRVARAAARFLERRPRAGLAERLVAIVESDAAPTHARGYALDILCSATCWVRLERLLRLTASASAQAAAWARTRIETCAWMPPTDAERDAVERALAAAVLDAGNRAFVRGELDLWRPRR